MTFKQLSIVLVLVAALAAGVVGVQLSKKKDTEKTAESRRGKQVFPDLPLDKIASISVIKKDESVTLKKSDGSWTVVDRGSYPANFPDIRTLLLDVANLKIVDTVGIESKNYGVLNLQDPTKEESEEKKSATKVELKGDDGKAIATLFIGKEPLEDGAQARARGMESKSIYVRAEGMEGAFLVNKTAPAPATPPGGFPVSALSGWLRFDSAPSDWIDKAFFNVSNVKTIEVKHPDPKESWKAVKTPAGKDEVEDKWDLADLEPEMELDINSKASGIRYLLANPSFREVLSPEQTKELDWSKDPISAVISTDDGFKYELTMIKTDPEGTSSDVYLKVNTSAILLEKRIPVLGESDEVKLRADADFAANLPRLKLKLKKDQTFNDWVFEVSEYNVSTLLKKRSEIIKEKEKEEKPEEPGDPTKPEDPTKPTEPADPTKPDNPSKPTEPTDPVKPVDPSTPTEPTDPVKPDDPSTPTEPADPAKPVDPSKPTEPADPAKPVDPSKPAEPADPTKPVDPSAPESPAADTPSPGDSETAPGSPK